MMAESIIRKMANPEIFPVCQEEFAESILNDLKNCHVFVYDKIVFTVSRDLPVMHFYADNSGEVFYSTWNKFIKEVWDAIGFGYMIAPILNERIKKVARRGGWIPYGMDRTGYELFYIQRRQ